MSESPTPADQAEEPQPWDEHKLRGRILFLEDSKTSAAVTVHYLEQFGLQVRHVTTAEAGIEELGFEFDLVLSDFFLDGELTGLDFVREVRQRGDNLSLLPILMLTSAQEADTRIASLRAGANDYVYKPFHPEELYARLNNLLALRHAYKKLYTQKKVMERLSVTDGLTNLYNKRCLNNEAPGIVEAAQRDGQPLALLAFDLDHFKTLNDNHGHDMGDTVLRAVAQAVEEEFQEVDLIARYGGEEFLVVLYGSDREQAAERAEGLRLHLQDLSPSYPVTASLGVSAHQPGEPERDYEQLFREADQALYKAKNNGRNRVAVWTAPDGHAELHSGD